MFYRFLRPLLFQMEPEKAHRFALNSLQLLTTLHLSRFIPPPPPLPCTVMGLAFPNPVGLAAGFDKNGDYIDALAALGFGFIEVGTITPKAQAGNPPPRLFRLAEEEAIINRLGFNNKGVDYLVERLQKTRFRGILGVNLGKNRDTSLENAVQDYIYGFRRIAAYASYITINISSPNTPDLRNLQHGELLRELLQQLKREQARFLESKKKYLPLVLKLAPDLNDKELREIAEVLLAEKIDGVIATNTTLSREGIQDQAQAKEAGGLSGKPLCALSTTVIRKLQGFLQNQIPIIASGGVFSEAAAQEKLQAGASLVQIYSGFIYQGPGWVSRLVKSCLKNSEVVIVNKARQSIARRK